MPSKNPTGLTYGSLGFLLLKGLFATVAVQPDFPQAKQAAQRTGEAFRGSEKPNYPQGKPAGFAASK